MQRLTETSGAGFSPWFTSLSLLLPLVGPSPHSKSPHEFSMRLAAHLCGDRPYRHHRARTKLVNLLTARTFSMGVSSASWCMHRACTCRTNSSTALVSGCAMVRENTMFLAALIIWSHLKSPTTAMLMGIGENDGPPELSLFSVSSTTRSTYFSSSFSFQEVWQRYFSLSKYARGSRYFLQSVSITFTVI